MKKELIISHEDERTKVALLEDGKLFELQDIKYRDFHAKLMPTVNKEKII